jgi:hypothetical protein
LSSSAEATWFWVVLARPTAIGFSDCADSATAGAKPSLTEGEFMTTWKITLIASLIGTAIGFWAWTLDLTKMVWPAHPQLAGFSLTLIATVGVQLTWPKDKPKTKFKP